MTSPSVAALVGLIAWTLFLLVLMEALRCRLVLTKTIEANRFRPDNANLSPFMQRLARAHANCIEGFPIFAGLLIVALLTQKTGITDPLALWLLAARLAQSCFHMASNSMLFANARFAALVVQVVIAAFWCWSLLTG